MRILRFCIGLSFQIYWQILFVYGKRSVYNLLTRTGNNYKNINQKPNISSNIKLSARLYWIMSGIKQLFPSSLFKNVVLIV